MKKSEENLTRLLKYIKEYFLTKGYAPNIREMCAFLNVKSTCTVSYYLNKLEDRGLIKRTANKNRAIMYLGEDYQMIQNSFSMIKLPHLGNIAGGTPLLAEENLIETFNVSQNLFGTNQDLFMLTVVGDSMKDIGIDHGDYVIAKIQNVAENGEIVIARTERGTTVKQFYQEQTCIRLQPQNTSHMPMYVNNVEILGKVIACIKRFDSKKRPYY